MPFTQKNRSIAIATPLGTDKLLLARLSITEQLGRPYVMKATLFSEEPAVDFLKLLGKGVTIRWRMPQEGGDEKKRFFSGYISSFVQLPRAEGFYNYEANRQSHRRFRCCRYRHWGAQPRRNRPAGTEMRSANCPNRRHVPVLGRPIVPPPPGR